MLPAKPSETILAERRPNQTRLANTISITGRCISDTNHCPERGLTKTGAAGMEETDRADFPAVSARTFTERRRIHSEGLTNASLAS